MLELAAQLERWQSYRRTAYANRWLGRIELADRKIAAIVARQERQDELAGSGQIIRII